MQEQQKQLVERLNQAQNILVTVSTNPSVDQLAAAIGLTLVLNHLGKHATAVFSGEVPSTLEFLKPEATLEKDTDSLRDFIIALDKSKADKLRYKVEDQVVRIFITPYKTSISEKDLDFSQGDFNVDVVVALGVREQQELDSAITAHGRILHDATVASIGLEAGNGLGTINWVDTGASSLSELVVSLAGALDKKVIDSQIATALLTGIVSATERFRNDKTTPKAMSASAELMAAGANQQLIATELEAAVVVNHDENGQAGKDQSGDAQSDDKPGDAQSNDDTNQAAAATPPKSKKEPGTLEIEHEPAEAASAESSLPAEIETPPEPAQPQVHVDEEGRFTTLKAGEPLPEISAVRGVTAEGLATESEKSEISHERLTEPPTQTGDLTANTTPEGLDPATEELTLPPLETPILSHNETVLSPATPFQPAPQNWQPPASDYSVPTVTPEETLAEIEQSVDSPHLKSAATTDAEPSAIVADARSAVEAAFNRPDAPGNPLEPIAALNAQPLGEELHNAAPAPVANTGFSEPTPGNTPADDTLDMPLPGAAFGSQPSQQPPLSSFPGAPATANDNSPPGPTSAPPVPPPFVPRPQ